MLGELKFGACQQLVFKLYCAGLLRGYSAMNYFHIAYRLADRAPWVAATTGVALCSFILASRAADTPRLIAPERIDWSVQSIFQKDDRDDKFKDQPRMNLSGAACAETTPKFKACLIANDEKRYAQFFSIAGKMLSPGALIRMSDADNDPDAEGVAYAKGYFYVTGSHGRSRHSDKANETSYAVFRIPVDPETGLPKYKFTDKKKAPEIDVSDRLREVLPNHPLLKTAYDKPLKQGGLNIEGIAVRNGRMHFGLRAPSNARSAYIASVDVAAAFTKADELKSKVTAVELGDNTGIRDIAAIEDGILILAGPTQEETVPYTIWHWSDAGDSLKPLATLDLKGVDPSAKAEILLPLDVSAASIRVLVMFDGLENGGPRSFDIKR